MKEPGKFSLSDINRKREEQAAAREPASAVTGGIVEAASSGITPLTQPETGAAGGISLPFDPTRLLVAAIRSWLKIGIASIVAGLIAALLGLWRFETTRAATVQLIRREVTEGLMAMAQGGDAFKPRQFSVATITALMQAPGFLKQVGEKAKPRVTGKELGAALTITPERNTDLISIIVKGKGSPEDTANLANQYANEVVELAKRLQSQEAEELSVFLRERLDKTRKELADANQELLRFTTQERVFSPEKEIETHLSDLSAAELAFQSAQLEAEALDFRIAATEKELSRLSPVKLKLVTARQELEDLSSRFTQEDPQVIEKLAQLKMIEQQVRDSTNSVEEFQAGGSSFADSLYLNLVNFRAERESYANKLAQLQRHRESVNAKLANLPEKSLRFASIKARQTSLEMTLDLLSARQREAELFSENSPGYYRLFSPTTPEQTVTSSRIRKVLIVTIVGPLLGCALALLAVCFVELLDDRVVSTKDVNRVAGIPVLSHLEDLASNTEAASGAWRFRTWSVVQRALDSCGERSFTVALLSAHNGEGRSTWARLLLQAAAERGWRTLCLVNRPPEGGDHPAASLQECMANPASVVGELDQSSRILIQVPADWVWQLEERARIQEALSLWRKTPRLVILVELPPATQLDAILMAELFPNVLWVCSSGATRQREVDPILKDLRLAQVKLRGALVNRLPSIFSKLSSLTRIGLAGVGGMLFLGVAPIHAQTPDTPEAPTNALFSAAIGGVYLAPWQQRLTLGPGDLLNLSIYGRPDSVRAAVPIGPDGRISFLQAQDIIAAGLTVDELRDKLTGELARFDRHARAIVTPSAYRSKKYFLMGSVVEKGVYILDRPMTIIDATARARGIATGLLDLNTIEIADLPRAFLVRNGERMPVDFEKLFQEGDLTQNILLEPGDYLYFPSALANEVFVLGAVNNPGPVGVTSNSSLLSVIATRGGFTSGAFKTRVLIVRGSLTKPETIVVNSAKIAAAQALDVRIEPKDIIYVSERPWLFAEEMIDTAVSAFIQSAAANWASKNIGPFITEPFIPSTR